MGIEAEMARFVGQAVRLVHIHDENGMGVSGVAVLVRYRVVRGGIIGQPIEEDTSYVGIGG